MNLKAQNNEAVHPVLAPAPEKPYSDEDARNDGLVSCTYQPTHDEWQRRDRKKWEDCHLTTDAAKARWVARHPEVRPPWTYHLSMAAYKKQLAAESSELSNLSAY